MCRQFVTSHFFVHRTMNITAREILPARHSSIFRNIQFAGLFISAHIFVKNALRDIIWLSAVFTINIHLAMMLECCPWAASAQARPAKINFKVWPPLPIREESRGLSVWVRPSSREDVRWWCPQYRSESTASRGSPSPGSPRAPGQSPGGRRRWSCPRTRGPGPGRRWRGGWRASAPDTACLSPARTGSWWTGRRSVWWRPPCSATEFPWEARRSTETSRSDWPKLWITSKIGTPSASSFLLQLVSQLFVLLMIIHIC